MLPAHILSISAMAWMLSNLAIAVARTAVGPSIFVALKIDHCKLFQYSLEEKYSHVLTGVPFGSHAFPTEAIASTNAQTTNNVQANNLAIFVIILV